LRPDEVSAFGDLAADAAAETAGLVRDLHEAIARRVFAAVGPGAAPVRATHDRIAHAMYASSRGLVRGIVEVGALAASATRPADAPSIERSTFGRAVVGALNGLYGDAFMRRGNQLALEMTLRRGGQDVDLTATGLCRAFPDATPRVAVFVHGLCETDDAWNLGSPRNAPYGVRLRDELGYTPLYVRYNTGRHVSENGRDLARLLEAVVAGWRFGIEEIVLIGHSMGGLVARSACHYSAGGAWCGKVRHVFTLGTPHLGAPLEQAAHLGSAALARLPETRGLARVLNARSAGIKDLRYGYLLDECWLDQDPDAFLRNTSREVPFLGTASHYFVCATMSRDPDAPLGRLIGDLLVLRPSAWAHAKRSERLRFPIQHYHHVGGANHFDLLNHPAIYEQIRRWVAGPGVMRFDPAQRDQDASLPLDYRP
jgi:pimeloyl-ACP methyl ester carboxylesterase